MLTSEVTVLCPSGIEPDLYKLDRDSTKSWVELDRIRLLHLLLSWYNRRKCHCIQPQFMVEVDVSNASRYPGGVERFRAFPFKTLICKGYRASRKGMRRFSQLHIWNGVLRCEKLMIEQNQQSATETGVITMTSAAENKVRELLKQENDPTLGLRIFVAGGGCSGLQYGMTLDEEQEGDTVISIGDFKVFVDDMSLGYITGSEVDYVDSLMGAGFTVNNPNAVSSCGCGHSFKTANDSGEARGCGCSH